MSVKINLLPDLRQAKIRARHMRQLAAAVATVVSGVAIGAVVLLLIITTAQKLQIQNLTKTIADNVAELNRHDDLETIVTLQQHLESLPTLREGRPSLLAFLKVLETITPAEISFSSIDVTGRTELKATGVSKTMAVVDKLDKAMEASKNASGGKNFSTVNVSVESQDTTGIITFDMTATVSQEVTNHATN